MLGLQFQNPVMQFFISYEEKQCHLCTKRTNSFFLVSIHFPICSDCFDMFFVKYDTKFI